MTLEFREWGPQPLRAAVMTNAYAFALELGGASFSMTTPVQYTGDSDTAYSSDAQWTGPEQEVFRVLADCFSKVPQVASICAQFSKEEVVIWTLLEKYDRAAREKVYQKELEVCQRLGIYDFDFRVSSAQLVDPNELVRAGSVEIYKRP
jgi:hypothetical protein